MLKKPLTYWILAILLFIAFILTDYYILKATDGSTFFEALLIETGSDALVFVMFGLALGILAALIPFRGMKHRKKLLITFPICTALVIGFTLYVFGESAYLISKYGPPPKKYSKVYIPPLIDCSSVHDGLFETKNEVIERSGEYQKETSKDSNKANEYKVKWLSDCEYYLLPKADTTRILKIKITKVDTEGYDCYITSGTDAFKVRLIRLKRRD